MGLFDRFKTGLKRTQEKLSHEIKRIVTRSPKLTADSIEELEYVLLSSDLGVAMTTQIIEAAKKAFESQGKSGMDFIQVAQGEIEASLSSNEPALKKQTEGVTVLSMVGVNGTGKTTTSAKLAHWMKGNGQTVVLAACAAPPPAQSRKAAATTGRGS